MPQALITINGSAGSALDLPINTLVQLDNTDVGGEVTHTWQVLSQPSGALDSLSSGSVKNPTFTPRKEGTYYVKLTVNVGLASEVSQTVVAAVRQLKTRIRVPAAGETVESDSTRGWSTDLNAALQKLDTVASDPVIIVGVAGQAGLLRGQVLKVTGTTTIKTGLPGQEVVPTFSLAPATTNDAAFQGQLCVLESGVDGSSSPNSGALIRVRAIGQIGPLSGSLTSGAIYVNDSGNLDSTPGTHKRQVGVVLSGTGTSYYAWFGRASASLSAGAVGSPTATGLTIDGDSVSLAPADATHPGIITFTSQTFGGDKTFTGNISASNLSGTNSGDVTVGAVGAPSNNGLSVAGQALSATPADATHPGIITTSSQTIAGAKTFTGNVDAPVLSTGSTTARKLSDRFGYAVNVKDFGAKGDGTTDDTVAIQAALNVFTDGVTAIAGGSLCFPGPAGTVYKITNPLIYGGSPAYPLRIYGEVGASEGGNGCIIRWAGASGGTMLLLNGANHLTVENLDFDGNNTAKYGIWATTTYGLGPHLLGTNVTPGVVTVTPDSMVFIGVGSLLNVDSGANLEYVVVTAATGTTFTATFTKSHTSTAIIGGAAGSNNNVFKRVGVVGVNGSAAAAVILGNNAIATNFPLNNYTFEDCIFQGQFSGVAGWGIQVIGNGGNTKNFYVKGGEVLAFQTGIDVSKVGPGACTIVNTLFSNNVLDIGASGGKVLVQGIESEGATKFISGNPSTNDGAVTVLNCSWQGACDASDVLISYQGAMLLMGNTFYNLRTGASVPQIHGGGSFFSGSSGATITSITNYYQNAVAGYAPLYDSGVTALLPFYSGGSQLPPMVLSINDYGGPQGTLVKLNNYLATTQLVSQTTTSQARSGMVRAGDTDVVVAFRNHANNGDVVGLSKDSSDIVHVGGTAGVVVGGPVDLSSASTLAIGGATATEVDVGRAGQTVKVLGNLAASSSAAISVFGTNVGSSTSPNVAKQYLWPDGYVRLAGHLVSTSGTVVANTVLCTLDAAYRPNRTILLQMVDSTGAAGYVTVGSDGTVKCSINLVASTNELPLDAVIFKASN